MAVNVNWYNEDNDILVIRYQGRWTWQEAHAANATSHRLLQATQSRIDLVIDMGAIRSFPPAIAENFQMLAAQPYKNMELMVLVGNSFVHDMLQVYIRDFNPPAYNLAFAGSLRQAIRRIRSSRRPPLRGGFIRPSPSLN